MAKFKCPWCGRQVEWHKDRVPRHVQSAHVQCVGSGQPRHQVEAQMRIHAQVLADNLRPPRFDECWVTPDGQTVRFVGRPGTRRGWQFADGTVISKQHVIRAATKDEARRFQDALGRPS